MTVERRDGRPTRSKGMRGTRTGVVAVLALSAGFGCGQPLLRPQNAPGVAAGSDGRGADPLPGRKLAWADQPAGPPATSAASAGKFSTGSVPGASAGVNDGISISMDKLNAGLVPPVFDGSTFARTTWNGWKLPESKPADPVAATQPATTSPDLAVVSAPTVPKDPLVAASTETHIALPKPASGASGDPASIDSLLSACKSTKIAPPRHRPKEATAEVTTPAAGLDSVAATVPQTKIAQPAATPAPPRVETPVANIVPETAPIAAPNAEPVAPVVVAAPAPEPAAPIVVASPAPDLKPQPEPAAPAAAALIPEPKPEPETAPIVEESATLPALAAETEAPAVESPETLLAPVAPVAVVEKVVELPEPALAEAAVVDPLIAASQATSIELPKPRSSTTESLDPQTAASSLKIIELPLPRLSAGPTPAPGAEVDPVAAASRATKIELPRKPKAAALPAPMPPAPLGLVNDPLQAASDASSIPLPFTVRTSSGGSSTSSDPLLEACKASRIPPPVPPQSSR